jgi:antitoxin component YwqK of YwqJK toxin-antitoxin module
VKIFFKIQNYSFIHRPLHSRLMYFLSIIFILFIIIDCKANDLPSGIPEAAKFDRKKNIYILSDEKFNYVYYPNGSLYEKCEHDENLKLNGRCENYLKDSNKIISYGNFKNGQRHGVWTWTFPDGQNYVIQNFTYGKKKDFWIPIEIWGNENGPYQRFYPNGILEEEGSFDTGEKTGFWKKYYPDGSLEYTGNYLKSKKILDWKYFYPNDNLEAKELYDRNGVLIQRTTYYPNGSLWCIIKSSEQATCN